MKSICILGVSGSIGSQCLDIVSNNPNDFVIKGISIGDKTRKLSNILKKFPSIKYVCLKHKKKYYEELYPHINFYHGDKGLIKVIKESNSEMIINALVGFVGLKPSLETLKENKILALANKESLVVGGELINKLIRNHHGKLYPIDSEHVGLAKCLSVDSTDVEKLIITASGGSLREYSIDKLASATKDEVLAHPTWSMGNKITVDSATMMNKLFEVIEAYQLYHYPSNKIEILMHKESKIHALVKYLDGSYRLDYSKPDMHNPIKWAMYEGLISFDTYKVNDYHSFNDCSFFTLDYDRYPILKWKDYVLNKKGDSGCIINAANEVAVEAFLKGEISFTDIEKVVSKIMETSPVNNKISYSSLKKKDKEIRLLTRENIERRIV